METTAIEIIDRVMATLNSDEHDRLRSLLTKLVEEKNQTEVAAIIGISQPTLSNYLNKDKRQIPRYNFDRLAQALGMLPEELLAFLKGRPLAQSINYLTIDELADLQIEIAKLIQAKSKVRLNSVSK